MQQLSAEDFLDRMQQLILNSAMNSTYKLALVLSITDAAVLKCADPGAVGADGLCRIALADVAREFLRIYWPQRLAYPGSRPGVKPAVLSQSFNRRGGRDSRDAVFNLIDKAVKALRVKRPAARLETYDQFAAADKRAGDQLASRCATLIRKNPLRYIARDAAFLFESDGSQIVMAASSLRLLVRFRPIISELAQTRWISHLFSLEKNRELLGETAELQLRSFLFAPERDALLEGIRTALIEAAGDERCFYCGASLRNKPQHVDHFLPFSRYAHTRIFNFVLACPRCNCSKSNWLADLQHVEHWVRRNSDQGRELLELSRDTAPAGALEVADMALALYRLAGGHAEPLWKKSGASGLTYDPGLYAAEIVPLLQNNRENMTRLADARP